MRLVGDGLVDRCGGGSVESICMDSWLQVGRAPSVVEHDYEIIDGDGERGNEIKNLRLNCRLQSFKEISGSKQV